MENENQNTNPESGEKTFTQDDVNRIVGERLAKEKNKGEQDSSKKEQELIARENQLLAKEMLIEKGLPKELHEALNCADKETLEKSIGIIESVIKERMKENPKATRKGVTPGEGNHTSEHNVDDADIRSVMGLSN